MKVIKLNKGRIALVDDNFFHFSKYKWHVNAQGYAVRHFRVEKDGINKLMRMHHCVIGFPLNKKQIDHINGNTLDNRIKNLRIVSHRENSYNTKYRRLGKITSKYIGVTKTPNNKWQAQIKINGISIYIGRFENEEDAGKAYLEKLEKINELPDPRTT